MKKNKLWLLIVLYSSFFISAEVTYAPVSKSKIAKWDADSLFIGADLVAKDSLIPVIVTLKLSVVDTNANLYFMVPGQLNSGLLLFHCKNVATNKDTFNLGTFPNGTKLVFRCLINRANGGISYYSGQNRDGIDSYLSNIQGTFGRRWVLAGQVDSNRVVVGFDWGNGNIFKSMVFYVDGAKIKK